MAEVFVKTLPPERFEHLTDELGVRESSSSTRQQDEQLIGAIELLDSITEVREFDLQGPSTTTPKLPLGLSLRNFVRLVVCITLLIAGLMYQLGQKLRRCYSPRRTPLKRSVATQSQTTYTAVARDYPHRFKVLRKESNEVWIE